MMSGNITDIPLDINRVGDLPVATFAFILIGVGLGVALLVFLTVLLVFKYRQSRIFSKRPLSNGSKLENIRSAWEIDTRKRLEGLKQAGYTNWAFQNLDDYQLFTVDEYADELDPQKERYEKLRLSIVPLDINNKSDDNNKRVTFGSLPVVQINGTSVKDKEIATREQTGLVAKQHDVSTSVSSIAPSTGEMSNSSSANATHKMETDSIKTNSSNG